MGYPKPLDTQKIIELINQNLSSQQIAPIVNCSYVHVKKWVKIHAIDHYEKLILNGFTRRNNSNRGNINCAWRNNKGKTYEQIYGNKADEMRKKRSNWLKANNIRKFATRISKPQAILFSIVKEHFPQAEIEYEIKLGLRKSIWLDIAIPDLKINIEYDGMYWHKLNKTTIRTSDAKRDEFLKNTGWTIFRIQSEQNLTETQLRSEFGRLQLI